jgi:hypothetical protein
MSEQTFEDRVARLEEHIVNPSPEDDLTRAERYLAAGEHGLARLALERAKLRRFLDEWEQEDADDA